MSVISTYGRYGRKAVSNTDSQIEFEHLDSPLFEKYRRSALATRESCVENSHPEQLNSKPIGCSEKSEALPSFQQLDYNVQHLIDTFDRLSYGSSKSISSQSTTVGQLSSPFRCHKQRPSYLKHGPNTANATVHDLFQLCNQSATIPFNELLELSILNKISKLGESSYSEVFSVEFQGLPAAIKIIPIRSESSNVIAPPRKLDDVFTSISDVYQEVKIAKCLSELNTSPDSGDANFVECYRSAVIQGKYPKQLVKAWHEWKRANGTDNSSPDNFDENQIFVAIFMEMGGEELEKYILRSMRDAYCLFAQITLSIAYAEQIFRFEHRDLHWSNILVKKTSKSVLSYSVDGCNYEVQTNGLRAVIIDFTLSRLSNDNQFIYSTDLSTADIFDSEGDIQFDVYREMRQIVRDWQEFCPKTNVLWLSYIATKLLKEKKIRASTKEKNAWANFLTRSNDYSSASHMLTDEFFGICKIKF